MPTHIRYKNCLWCCFLLFYLTTCWLKMIIIGEWLWCWWAPHHQNWHWPQWKERDRGGQGLQIWGQKWGWKIGRAKQWVPRSKTQDWGRQFWGQSCCRCGWEWKEGEDVTQGQGQDLDLVQVIVVLKNEIFKSLVILYFQVKGWKRISLQHNVAISGWR